MAITIDQKPQDVEFYNQILMYRCSSSNVSNTGFKYVVKVTIDSEVTKYYIDPNIQGKLMFDLYDTAKDFIGFDINDYNTTDSIHSLPNGVVNRSFSQSEASCKKVTVDIEEGWIASGVFAEQGATGAATHDIYLVNGSQEYSYGDTDSRFIDGGYYPKTGNLGWLTDREADTFTPHEQDFGFGSSAVRFIPCYEDDWGVVSFFHDAATVIANSDSYEMRYALFEEDGTQIGTTETRTINSTYGGTAPTSTNQEDKVLHFGCFPKNISEFASFWTNHPDSGNDWKYYWVRIYDSSINFESHPLVFVKQCDERLKARIGWWGQSGGWEYFNFTKRKEDSLTVQAKTIKKKIGSWQGSSFRFDKHDRGEAEFGRRTEKFLAVESDYISEGEFTYLQSLIRSKEVMLINDDGSQTPLILETKNYVSKAEKGIEQYNVQLRFKYAQEMR